jgi:hypothetical protein
MTVAQIEKIRKSIKSITKDIKPGSKESMAFLVKSGIYDKDGKLRKAYR